MFRVSFPPSATFLPLWAAKDAGFFNRNGVPTELVFLGSSPVALAALIANQIDIAAGVGSIGVASHAQGYNELVFFSSLNNKMNYMVYAQPTIVDVNGLRGKRFGVSRFGGIGDFVTRYFLKRVGLDPRKDLTLVQLGNQPDITSALMRKSIDAAAFAIPYAFTVKKLGFREIADLTQSDGRYAGAAFMSKKSFILNNKVRMEAFIRSLIQGTHYVRTQRDAALRILSRYTRVTDKESLETSLDYSVKNVWAKIPEIQPADMDLIIEQLQETNARARDIKPTELVYSQLMDEVKRTGIVEELYK
jgi:NitT/TauT family transport system substrate-binding protein